MPGDDVDGVGAHFGFHLPGDDFDGFGGHFGFHFESNFGPDMWYFSSYFLIGCWMWF